jgi:Protein of unknown function (DUF3606)
MLANRAISSYRAQVAKTPRRPGPGHHMAILTKRAQSDRSKINMSRDHEVKYWAHELGITRAQLQQIVNKVGNPATAIRKELAR